MSIFCGGAEEWIFQYGRTARSLRNAKSFQMSDRLVERTNAVHFSKASKVLAVRKIKSRDVLVASDSQKTNNLTGQEDKWSKVKAERTKVTGRCFRVMLHTDRTNRIETVNQEEVLAELQAQNPQLKNKVKSLKVDWRKKTLKAGKLHGPLLIDVEMPEEAKVLVLDGLLHDHGLKKCKIFHSECNMTQCYKCYCYGHIGMMCRRLQTC
jgi:hypothetical protein